MPWTATIHDLLVHIRAHAGPVVPEPVAVADGVEIVSFLPGDAGQACWPWQATDAGLRSAAVLLRRVHEATRSWHPPADARWSRPAVAGADVVCHGDPGPWNMVWNGGVATGLFDWDLAYPGPALDDVAYALEYLVPFRSDEAAVPWHGFTEPPDRPRRMALFAQAYGLPGTAGLVDAVLERQRATSEHVALLAADGIEPQRTWVAQGFLAQLESRLAWGAENRDQLLT
jgi:aminoglycoside phosphotransferase (APT) family kinase protein